MMKLNKKHRIRCRWMISGNKYQGFNRLAEVGPYLDLDLDTLLPSNITIIYSATATTEDQTLPMMITDKTRYHITAS